MLSIYEYYINGIKCDEPINWQEFSDETRIDDNLHSIVTTVDLTAEFTGSVFRYLFDLYLNEKIDKQLSVLIKYRYGSGSALNVYEGILNISDVEFNHRFSRAKVKLIDNNFFGKIDGRKSIVAYCSAGKSINETSITPIDDYFGSYVDFCTGGTVATNLPKIWRIEDICRYLIAFTSDNTVGFRSPLFSSGGEYEFTCLSLGKYMRIAGEPIEDDRGFYIDLETLLNKIYKKFNAWWYIEKQGTQNVLVIDKYENIFTSGVTHELTNLPEITEQVDVTRLYASVDAGGDDFTPKTSNDCSDGAFYDQEYYYGCKTNQYPFKGFPSVDASIDLTDDFIVSSNIIQEIFATDTDQYDDNYFWVDCSELITGSILRIIQGEYFGFNGFQMNRRLYNKEVLDRFYSAFPNSVVNFLGASLPTFNEVKASFQLEVFNPTVSRKQITFPTSIYTSTQRGFYTFGTDLIMDLGPAWSTAIFEYRVTFVVLDSISVFKYERSDSYRLTSGGLFNYRKLIDLFLEVGDQVYVTIDGRSLLSAAVGVDFLEGSLFYLSASSADGATYIDKDINAYRCIKANAKTQIQSQVYDDIIANRFAKKKLSDAWGNSVSGWIQSIKHNKLTTETNITLLTSKLER